MRLAAALIYLSSVAHVAAIGHIFIANSKRDGLRSL